MDFHLLRYFLFIVAFNLFSFAFSQKIRGVYLPLVILPKDAPSNPLPGTGNGLEFPIKLTKATIQLKWFHRLKYIVTNLDDSNPVIFKGKWTASGKIIDLKIRSADSLQLGKMEYMTLKSGNYIRWGTNSFEYYKKK